jgi:hypothetical protein
MPRKPKPPEPVAQLVTITPTPRDIGKSRRGGKTLLTDGLQEKIVEAIRNGAWDWVAAESNGVDRFTFWEWVKRGEDRDDRPQEPCYAQFAQAVREARAQARKAVEINVHKTDGLNWLMKGPGRDRPGEPGWTDRPSQDALPHITVILAGDGKV